MRSNEVKELDLKHLLLTLLNRGWIVALTAVIGAVLAALISVYLITPQYQSSAMFYVNNNSLSIGDTSVSIESGDITAKRNLVEVYLIILESREHLVDVIDYSGVDRTYKELQEMITASSVNSTEIFKVVVTSPDPQEARSIAAAIEQTLPKRITKIIDGTSAEIVDSAVTASAPSSPDHVRNIIIGFLAGFVISVAAIVLRVVFDVTIRAEEDVQASCNHPVLASVPDMNAQTKGGHYYYGRYGQASKRHSAAQNGEKQTVLVGAGISFAASEAYKLLRTKLQFSFVDDRDCHIIGVSSAMAGEGKSLSSINLAYSLAQLEKRVLLIDCDMRRPSLDAKLPIEKVPGLSNYLTRQVHKPDVIQKYKTEECEFDVISSGRNPPNPIELLSSERMATALEQMRQSYDYIILDLPPVGEVSDALVAAKLVDGILLVVRQNYCSRPALAAAASQFSFIGTRVLGVVFNCTVDGGSRYGKRYYRRYGRYGRYYGRYYGSRYESSYLAASRQNQEAAKEQPPQQ